MPDPGLLTAKMRAYMEALSPAARSMLMRAMRTAEADSDPANIIKKIFASLEAAGTFDPVSSASPKVPKSDLPWDEQIREAFFQPLQPFVCEVSFSPKMAARIQAASLDQIWTYLVRDLAPSLFSQAFLSGASDQQPDVVQIARKLRRELLPTLSELIQSGDLNSKDVRRVVGQLGSEIAFLDFADAIYVFQKEGALLNFSGQLPKTLSAFELSEAGPVSELVKKTLEGQQIDPAFLASVLVQRCASPASVVMLAITLAGSSDPKILHSSPYTKLIDGVISAAQLLVHRFERHLKDRSVRLKALEDLREYNDLIRQLDLVLQPNQVPVWHRQLGAARKKMSDLIAAEIEPLPGLIRRSLRIEPGSEFDLEATADAEYSAKLLIDARNALDSLALYELVTKLRRPVEQTLEVVTAKVMADFKSITTPDKTEILKVVDAAIRMSAVVFGEDYAAVMRKSRDLVVNKTTKAG